MEIKNNFDDILYTVAFTILDDFCCIMECPFANSSMFSGFFKLFKCKHFYNHELRLNLFSNMFACLGKKVGKVASHIFERRNNNYLSC